MNTEKKEEKEKVSPQIKKKFKMYETLLEILEARGYVVGERYLYLKDEEFSKCMHEVERILVYKDNDDGGEPIGLAVHLNFGGDKVTENFITNFINTIKDVKNFLIVAPTKNNQAEVDKNGIKNVQDTLKHRIQVFKDEDLLFNVLKHDLVPKHILLSETEKTDILKYYKVKESQLPKLLSHDPVARFLGLHKGNVVKIIRKSETAGTYTTYRVVV